MDFEGLSKVNEKLKAIDVKGKGYVQVNERVKGFRELCPNGRIETEIVDLSNGVVTMKAYVSDDNGKLLATGYAQEKETSSYINKTSFIENCETSAIGRALGWVGIGVDGSMASAEEVANAIINQNNDQVKAEKKPSNAKKQAKEEGNPEDTVKAAYPIRDEMIAQIAEHYADDKENFDKMLAFFKVKSLKECSDAQIMTVWSKKVAK